MKWNEQEASEFILQATIWKSHLPASLRTLESFQGPQVPLRRDVVILSPGKKTPIFNIVKKVEQKSILGNLGWHSEPGSTGDKAQKKKKKEKKDDANCCQMPKASSQKENIINCFQPLLADVKNEAACACKRAMPKREETELPFLNILKSCSPIITYHHLGRWKQLSSRSSFRQSYS